MMPLRRFLPLLCVGLLLAACSAKTKQADPAPAEIPLEIHLDEEVLEEAAPPAEPPAAVVHLRSGKKRGPGEARQDGRAHTHRGTTYVPSGHRQRGVASWYGKEFHGRRTASGEPFNMHGDTAAHRTLPMHTRVLVRNLDNGRSTVVRINDRGPYGRGRIIDLSHAKARELGFAHKGKARVELVALKPAGTAGAAAKAETTTKTAKAGGSPRAGTVPRLTPARSKRRPR